MIYFNHNDGMNSKKCIFIPSVEICTKFGLLKSIDLQTLYSEINACDICIDHLLNIRIPNTNTKGDAISLKPIQRLADN